MNAELNSLSGLMLMLILGLRHGLDPDHIAVIDGLTLRAVEQHSAVQRWVGTLFALGHGLVVTLIAMAVSKASLSFGISASVAAIAGWVPTVLLIVVGCLNLRALLRVGDYHSVGWKSRFLPQRLRSSSHPVVILLVGMLFALVFDTATQAAAWGYAATAQGGLLAAFYVGLVFTLGMVITDTLDCRLACQMLHNANHQGARRYRRVLGWLIVGLSFGIAGYNISSHFFPELTLSDTAYSTTGAMLFGLVLCGYVWLAWHTSKLRRRQPASVNIDF